MCKEHGQRNISSGCLNGRRMSDVVDAPISPKKSVELDQVDMGPEALHGGGFDLSAPALTPRAGNLLPKPR